MRTDLFIPHDFTENRIVPHMVPAENKPGFRIFRVSPDTIDLQVRTNSDKQVRIAGVGLDRNQAKLVAERLLQFANGGD